MERKRKEERDRKRTNQALSTRMTRTQRMSKRAQKRHAEEQERTAKVEGEDESRPSKKRKRQSSNIASTQARTAKVEAVPAPSNSLSPPIITVRSAIHRVVRSTLRIHHAVHTRLLCHLISLQRHIACSAALDSKLHRPPCRLLCHRLRQPC